MSPPIDKEDQVPLREFTPPGLVAESKFPTPAQEGLSDKMFVKQTANENAADSRSLSNKSDFEKTDSLLSQSSKKSKKSTRQRNRRKSKNSGGAAADSKCIHKRNDFHTHIIYYTHT